MKWKISTQVILRCGEGFNEQELLSISPLINLQDARNVWVAYSHLNSIFFVCPRKPFRQINDFSRGFILKLGSQKRRIINAHLR